MPESWQPNIERNLLRFRAQLLDKIRDFMRQRNVLEVDTPILSRAGIPDPNIHSLSVSLSNNSSPRSLYLNTSPEFCMKRLLASGSGAIFQITKVFRDDEIGRLHQPEFSMLEWYRPGYDHHKLMQEVSELLLALGCMEAETDTYENAFVRYLDVNPHKASMTELQNLAAEKGLHEHCDERSVLLEFLFSHSVSHNLGREKPLLLYHYPACQASLARLSDNEPASAERFELFINGMELANGFHELTNADEQAQRFARENQLRQQKGLAEIVIDRQFLAALQAGLPDCAGVAIGLDRLIMALLDKQHINDVMTFPLGEA